MLVAILAFIRALWASLKDPKFRGLIIFVTTLLLVGMVFYHRVEGWSYLNSLYFCVVTLATVGYGDFTPKTSLGKVFTMIYIILGIGAFLVFVNTLTADIAKRRSEKK